jgi:hypothetical protein
MRWDALFADLEAQLAEAARAEFTAEVADRSRREAASLRLVDRLGGLRGQQIRLVAVGGVSVAGALADLGPDWLLIHEAPGRQVLVPIAAVLTVGGAHRLSATAGSEGAVRARLTLGYALRAIARDRAPVSVVLTDATSRSGTIDRVGSDFVELAEHAAGEPRRAAAVTGVLVVAFSALVVVRST